MASWRFSAACECSMNLGLCHHPGQPSSDEVELYTLLAGSRDTTVKLWNPSTCEVMQTLSGHKYQVNCRVMLNREFAALKEGRGPAGLTLDVMQVTDLAVMPDGSIVSASLDRYILQASMSGRYSHGFWLAVWGLYWLLFQGSMVGQGPIPTHCNHCVQHTAGVAGQQVHPCLGRP